jgi:hypothetical protein
MSKFFSSLILFVFFIVICFAGYVSYRYIDEKNSLQFTPIVQETASSTSTINDSSTVISEDVKVNTDKWKKYKNPELGYSISYPDDLIVNFDDTVLILAFPKKTYFHWPLQDDVKMVVNATSTCDSKQTDKKIYINGKEYELESDVTDAGAGSVWREMIFRFKQNDNCYKLTINTRGTNGAGFYVDDPALIKKYDAEHKNDVEKVMEIIYGVVNSFNFEQIPEGQIE